MISRLTLQWLSGLLVIVPIAIGLRALRFNRTTAGFFVAFLSIGVITELSMYLLVMARNIPAATTVFQCYSLLEALAFLWIVHRLTYVLPFKRAIPVIACIIPFIWIVCMFGVPRWAGFNYGSAIFDSTYEILVAFLAGSSLLRLAERPESLSGQAAFWLLFALFFYCFGTFFVMIFLKTPLAEGIWFLNNTVNVLTYGLYSVGLWKLASAKSLPLPR